MSFASDMEQATAAAMAGVEAIRRLFIGKLCIAIIDRTPVKSGYLKGNWQPTIGVAATDELPRKSKEGGFVKQEVEKILSKLQGDETFYFSNNAPYVLRIEYEGYSGKAPAGMVRISIAEVGMLINQAIAEASK